MLPKDSDRNWEAFGKTAPYFGVFPIEKLNRASLDEVAVAEFFQSGESHIADIIGAIRRTVQPEFQPVRCLDFGCGVGRLLIPLAKRFAFVVGVDVSPSMLAEAGSRARQQGLANVEFVESDDALAKVTGKFDFVHSYIVMQHIPKGRGERILRRLVELLNPGGVAALHFIYHWEAPRWTRSKIWLRENVPLVNGLINLAKGRGFNHPRMLMQVYDLNRLLRIIQRHGCGETQVSFTDHDGHLGAMLIFRFPSVRPVPAPARQAPEAHDPQTE